MSFSDELKQIKSAHTDELDMAKTIKDQLDEIQEKDELLEDIHDVLAEKIVRFKTELDVKAPRLKTLVERIQSHLNEDGE